MNRYRSLKLGPNHWLVVKIKGRDFQADVEEIVGEIKASIAQSIIHPGNESVILLITNGLKDLGYELLPCSLLELDLDGVIISSTYSEIDPII